MTSGQFLEFIGSLSIQVAIVVCATSLLCRIVETARLQCRMWVMCHVLILLLVVAGLVLPHVRIVRPWRALSPATAEWTALASSAVGRMVFVAWIAGATVSLLLFAREWTRAFRFLKTCRPAREREVALLREVEAADAERGFATRDSVQLLMSDQIGSPFCCQWHRAQLVLPSFLEDCDAQTVQLITRHELEHLRSGHPLQLFTERVVAILFWFHPMVWWGAQQSAVAREFMCDDACVAERRQVVEYLKVLVAVAERGISEEADGALLFFGRGASLMALRGRRLVARAESAASELMMVCPMWAQPALIGLTIAVGFVWAPLDVLASSQRAWSPWPRWSAVVLQALDVPARDFEPYETRTRMYEISEAAAGSPSAGLPHSP